MKWGSHDENMTFTQKGRAELLLDVPLLYADTESVISPTGHNAAQAIV